MLRHAFFLDGQERFEEGIWLMQNGNLVLKIKRLVRASALNRRVMSQACVKREISSTESNKFLTTSSWASFSIPLSKILLVGIAFKFKDDFLNIPKNYFQKEKRWKLFLWISRKGVLTDFFVLIYDRKIKH